MKKCMIIILIAALLSSCASDTSKFTVEDFVENDLKDGKCDLKDIFYGKESNGWVYYSNFQDGQSIYKIKTDGTAKEKMVEDECEVIDVIGDWIYYEKFGSVYKIKTNGNNRTYIYGYKVDKGKNIHPFKIIDDWIYFYESNKNEIGRVKLDGTSAAKLSSDSFDIICESNGWIYYIDYLKRNIYKMMLDGSNVTKLNDTCTRSFCINNEKIYYNNSPFLSPGEHINEIYTMDCNGNNKVLFNNKQTQGEDLVFKDNFLYYYNSEEGIWREKIDGTQKELISNSTGLRDFKVVGNWIYTFSVNDHNGEISRSQIEGFKIRKVLGN